VDRSDLKRTFDGMLNLKSIPDKTPYFGNTLVQDKVLIKNDEDMDQIDK